MDKEKVYISRDEGEGFDHYICVWRKPLKKEWSPTKMIDCELIIWRREDIDNMDMYIVSDFKKKFGFIIAPKTKKCCHLSKKLLYSENYKLFSDDSGRKK